MPAAVQQAEAGTASDAHTHVVEAGTHLVIVNLVTPAGNPTRMLHGVYRHAHRHTHRHTHAQVPYTAAMERARERKVVTRLWQPLGGTAGNKSSPDTVHAHVR